MGALRICGHIKSGGDGSPPMLLLNGLTGCEESDLRLLSPNSDLAEILPCDQHRHNDGNTDDDQGDNPRLVLLHNRLLLDPKVGKRLSL